MNRKEQFINVGIKEQNTQLLKQFIPLEIYRSEKQKDMYLEKQYYQIICATSTYVNMKFTEMDMKFDYIIVDQSSLMLELQLGLIIMNFGKEYIQKIILFGDQTQQPLLIFNKEMSKYTRLEKSLFSRLFLLTEN